MKNSLIRLLLPFTDLKKKKSCIHTSTSQWQMAPSGMWWDVWSTMEQDPYRKHKAMGTYNWDTLIGFPISRSPPLRVLQAAQTVGEFLARGLINASRCLGQLLCESWEPQAEHANKLSTCRKSPTAWNQSWVSEWPPGREHWVCRDYMTHAGSTAISIPPPTVFKDGGGDRKKILVITESSFEICWSLFM